MADNSTDKSRPVTESPRNTCPFSLDRGESSSEAVLSLTGNWAEQPRVPAADEILERLSSVQQLVVDGSALTGGYPRAAALIHALEQRLPEQGIELSHRALPTDVSALMALAEPADESMLSSSATSHGLWAWFASGLGRVFASGRSAAALVGEGVVKTPSLFIGRTQTRWSDFIEMVREAGASSLLVVTVVNILIGAVMGFIGAIQLAAFGADMYLADLVGLAASREMGAVMTAFIVAGRIGAAFAARLATMESNEEIDALRMVGVSPFEFLILPRLAALTLMMPLLYLYAAALTILGGMVVAHIVLGTAYIGFIERLQDAIALRNFVIGLFKAGAFGILIALASCHIGMSAGRNAAEVGRAATKTVVVCIIGVIIIDALAAIVTNALGV